MLLFWVLGAYVLTRSPRGAISLTAVGAQFSTALYLLSQGMQANAETIEQWIPWARNLGWGAHVAPLLWYWLTALLLGEQASPSAKRYLRFVGYPLGIVIGVGTVFFATAIYVDDALNAWSAVHQNPEWNFSRFDLPNGPLFLPFILLLAVSTVASFVNVWLGWRLADSPERRRCFRWLLVSAFLFILGADSLGIVNWSMNGVTPTWVGHLVLAAAMVVMAWNVAAYSLLFKGQVVRTDFLYVLTALTFVCILYGGVLLLSGASYSFGLLNIMAVMLSVAVLSHAFVDLGRRVLDRLFFGGDVRRLRDNFAWMVQIAGRAEDLDALMEEAHNEIEEVSVERLVGLTEQALRRLNNLAALGRTELADRIPAILESAAREAVGRGLEDATPLERAQAMRSVLIACLERLKPLDGNVALEAPAALQYHILREEYLQELQNKQIIARHNIGEGTFNRNRRQAIAALAEDLAKQEQLLSQDRVAVFGVSPTVPGSS